MMAMGIASALMVLFIALETFSLSLILLAGMYRHNWSSTEASLKYFPLGAFASGFFVYGSALIYGVTGTVSFAGMGPAKSMSTDNLGTLRTKRFSAVSPLRCRPWPVPQAGLPATAGRPATRTRDQVRHGTLSLRAALDLDIGRIYYACAARNRHQKFLAFLRPLARRFPTRQVHLVLDNYSPHKHRKVKAWREAHPRFHFHFIPTYSSWLNRVESWFSTLQRQVMDRGSFDDVANLQATLGRYVRSHNRRATPPQWKVKADAILAQLAQIRRTYEMVH